MIWFIIAGILVLSLAVLLLPWKEKEITVRQGIDQQIDERTIMFSRAELEPGTDRYEMFYEEFPEYLRQDQEWRKLAGLLNRYSALYNHLIFSAADATFFTVGGLHDRTDGPVSSIHIEPEPEQMMHFLRQWSREMGVHSVGITELKKHHLYSKRGRGRNYGEPVSNTHPLAIAFTVEMDYERVQAAPKGPIVLESSNQYLRSGIIAVQMAAWLRKLGYEAKAHIDGKYDVRCPQVARDAGLGEIGRMGLLMTPGLGPRVRIAVVTTNAPLAVTKTKPVASVIRFCQDCKKCASNCPSQAISHEDRKMINGALQWTINQEKCFTYWCKTGTDCGRCVAVCPYSHKDNLIHNSARYFIKNAPLFRKLAIHADDWIYGKKPPSKTMPDWMQIKN